MKAVRIVLIDGAKLGELMVQYNVGVETAQVFELKRVDEDFFS
jgi:restriction system protein